MFSFGAYRGAGNVNLPVGWTAAQQGPAAAVTSRTLNGTLPEATNGVIDKELGKQLLSEIAPSKRGEFFNVDQSLDPDDATMKAEDPRSYFYNKKARKLYKKLKRMERIHRYSQLPYSGADILAIGQGRIVNAGNGNMYVTESFNYNEVRFKKGDRLEVVGDALVMNKTAHREEKIRNELAERYEMSVQRDALRHPGALIANKPATFKPPEPGLESSSSSSGMKTTL
jgi:hypothetical protein